MMSNHSKNHDIKKIEQKAKGLRWEKRISEGEYDNLRALMYELREHRAMARRANRLIKRRDKC